MPPKKAAKGPAPEQGGELDAEQKLKLYMLTCQSLQVQLAERTEEASKAIAAKRELQARVDQISNDFETEKQETAKIMQGMTNQYKQMMEQMMTETNNLQSTVQVLKDQLDAEAKRRADAQKEHDRIVQMKDEEIRNLRKEQDDLVDEFEKMLQETLNKMKERIEITTGNFDVPDLPIQKRMEELRS
jgi:23S rRNA G2069 N7-methylase RlmK/C1962 C5-methylase RlmI